MVAYRGRSPRLAVVGVLPVVLDTSLVAVAPRPAAAIPTVHLTLSVKPSWIGLFAWRRRPTPGAA